MTDALLINCLQAEVEKVQEAADLVFLEERKDVGGEKSEYEDEEQRRIERRQDDKHNKVKI